MNAEQIRQSLTLIIAETPASQCWTLSTRHLLELVKEAQKAEREACAKLCEERERANLYGVKECAEAIRARGEK